jgi:hypothetical protein
VKHHSKTIVVRVTLIYSALDEDVSFFGDVEVIPGEKQMLAEWLSSYIHVGQLCSHPRLGYRNLYYPKLIADGKLKTGPLKVSEGLENIVEGLQELKEGKVSKKSFECY